MGLDLRLLTSDVISKYGNNAWYREDQTHIPYNLGVPCGDYCRHVRSTQTDSFKSLVGAK